MPVGHVAMVFSCEHVRAIIKRHRRHCSSVLAACFRSMTRRDPRVIDDVRSRHPAEFLRVYTMQRSGHSLPSLLPWTRLKRVKAAFVDRTKKHRPPSTAQYCWRLLAPEAHIVTVLTSESIDIMCIVRHKALSAYLYLYLCARISPLNSDGSIRWASN